MIPENTIQELKSSNIVGVIGQYVRLKKSGSGYVGLCPFHNEHTPSFTVSPARKIYKCFGCGASGDVYSFIMAYEQKTFPEAVEHLATMTGTLIDNDVPATPQIKPKQPVKPERVDYIPEDKISGNLAAYDQSNLHTFFCSLFGRDKANHVFRLYGAGSHDYFGEGTTLFVQRDVNGNARQVKVMMYDPITGKRNRNKKPRIVGITKDFAGEDANLMQCPFGEHLLSLPENKGKPVILVESEKTAMIGNLCYPEHLWLATGGKTGCNIMNPQVNKVLHGRHIHLYPDVDGVNDWRNVADELKRQGFTVFLNDIIAKHAAPGSKDDIADLIITSLKQAAERKNNPERWVTLNKLLNKSFSILKQKQSGTIAVEQWANENDCISDEITKAGLMKEYVKAVNF